MRSGTDARAGAPPLPAETAASPLRGVPPHQPKHQTTRLTHLACTVLGSRSAGGKMAGDERLPAAGSVEIARGHSRKEPRGGAGAILQGPKLKATYEVLVTSPPLHSSHRQLAAPPRRLGPVGRTASQADFRRRLRSTHGRPRVIRHPLAGTSRHGCSQRWRVAADALPERVPPAHRRLRPGASLSAPRRREHDVGLQLRRSNRASRSSSATQRFSPGTRAAPRSLPCRAPFSSRCGSGIGNTPASSIRRSKT